MKSQVLWWLLTFCSAAHTKQLWEGDACTTESGATGLCVRQGMCPAVSDDLRRGVRPSICCFNQNEPVVCCVTVATTPRSRHAATSTSTPRSRHTATSTPTPTPRSRHAATSTTTTSTTTTLPPVRGRSVLRDNAAINIVKQKCQLYGAYAAIPDDAVDKPRGSDQNTLSRLLQPQGGGPTGLPGEEDDDDVVIYRITGGEATVEGEFPHMAALGWGERGNIDWWCGGSLINERFILTAAHCLQARGRGLVRWVRLGTDVANETTEHTQLLEVKQIHRHENYSPTSYYHDIALLELHSDVQLSYYVRPACLHTEFIGPDHGAATATGWGALNSTVGGSLALMKVDLQFQRGEVCNSTYAVLARTRKLSRGVSEEIMICVGDLQDVKDTCEGDSGGPIQVPLAQPPNMHSIVGVTSFGAMGCGQARAPAIYTRVSHYVPWIVNIAWPDE